MGKFTTSDTVKRFRAVKSLWSRMGSGISMGIMVKNEVDIIEKNLKYHDFWGVEKFYIIDNGSTDGTYELINEELIKKYNLVLYRDQGLEHNQSENMTFLAHQARLDGFKWFIPNDADEFWMPLDLRKYSLNESPISRVERRNNVPVHEKNKKNWYSNYWVKNGIGYNLYKPFNNVYDKRNFIFAPVMHKSYVLLKGLIRIKGGNHGASNILSRKTRWDENICIYHLTLRSKEVFLKKVKDMYDSISYMNKIGRKHNFGPQAVFWAQAYENDRIDEVYENMFIDNNCLSCFEELDIIERNFTFEDSLRLAGVNLKEI